MEIYNKYKLRPDGLFWISWSNYDPCIDGRRFNTPQRGYNDSGFSWIVPFALSSLC